MYESDGKNETIIEEYRTSWLSYSEISQLAALWSEKWKNGKTGGRLIYEQLTGMDS